MYCVNRKIQAELIELIPFCFLINTFDEEQNHSENLTGLYDSFFISVFNKWLSAEECDKHTLCFQQYIENNDHMYIENENKIIKFYIDLFLHGAYTWKINEKNECIFYGFETLEDFKNIIFLSVREKQFVDLCLPQLKMIICSGFDLTYRIFIKKHSSSKEVYNLIKKHNLYVLK